GLAADYPDLADQLRRTTDRAFRNIIDLAVKEKVDAVIIAGDIYDGADKSLQAQLKFRDELARLSQAGIPSFIVHGNHDPLNSWSATLEWPEGVKVFPGDRVERVPLVKNGIVLAQIYGISFPVQEVKENLALRFAKESGPGFSIAVLHANVGGNANHINYSPCTEDDLVSRDMDYWALGHVHAHQVIRPDRPAIVYPGNSQGRNPREQGVKGCCLVTLSENAPADIRFIPTDVARYLSTTLDVSDCASVDGIIQSTQSRCESISSGINGRGVVIRMTLTGRTPLHETLQRGNSLQAIEEAIQTDFSGRDPWIWLELKLQTAGIYDLDELRQGSDFVADLIHLYDEMEGETKFDEIRGTLEPLFKDWNGSGDLENLTDKELQELLIQARDQTLDRLVERD
ncbi:MAG: exonuclease SbcCD subunit D, partial [Nitrospinales bacterium]